VTLRKLIFLGAFFLVVGNIYALEPDEILVIANTEIAESVSLAVYYCSKRDVPVENILTLKLSNDLSDSISRAEYDYKIAKPIAKKLKSKKFRDKISCILLTYGVPYKVGGRGAIKGQEAKLASLRAMIEQQQQKLRELDSNAASKDIRYKRNLISSRIKRLQSSVSRITGSESHASLDSELSMVLFEDYELHRWQANKLNKYSDSWQDGKTIMVCRLDGPDAKIAKGLVDKSMNAEKNGLKGKAYIDLGHSKVKNGNAQFAAMDRSLDELVTLAKEKMPVVQERTENLFSEGECPDAAIYCGWYSLKNYIDCFDFVDGAIGYHIASWEAIDIHDANSGQWCPSMLVDGVTATLGAVSEPYLHSFPNPAEFFFELFEGGCLVEAYYHTKPFNSWQFILIGDPLYRPFKAEEKVYKRDAIGISGKNNLPQ